MKGYRLSRRSLLRTLVVPALLLVLSTAGLVLALTGDGATDWVAALLLAVPVLAIARARFGAATIFSNKHDKGFLSQ